jgi:transposase-like protein
MSKSKLSEEQIALALKQAESITSVEEVCREMVVSRATFYLWRKKYGGLGVSELCRRYRRPITNPQSELLNASHLIASTRAWVSCPPVFVEASPCKGIRKLSST